MKVIGSLTIIPLGIGVSLSKYVAACERTLKEFDVAPVLHANGTNVEGEWDEVFAAIKKCHEVVHEMDVPRIFTTIAIGTRTDRDQTMDDKIRSVETKL
ncbi:MTH1187 family thiamine-binding protein [candidate division KSB1 bacterium]